MSNQCQKESLKSNIELPSVPSQYPGTIKLKQTKLPMASNWKINLSTLPKWGFQRTPAPVILDVGIDTFVLMWP
jgi:hypothetical protein